VSLGNIVIPLLMESGRELLSHGVAAIILFADDTVESLISFTDFIIKKEVMELKTANHNYSTDYLGK
jgi:hypothetical protein